MFQLDLGRSGRYCDGLNRRRFLNSASPAWRRSGCRNSSGPRPNRPPTGSRKNTTVILIWLDGGPGHMDMYDMKPDAPAEYRGLWKPISTNVPGFDITELYPKQAKITDKFSMVRSLHHDTGDHFAGGHRMLTDQGHGRQRGEQRAEVPRHRRDRQPRARAAPARHARLRRASPTRMSIGLRPGYFGGHMLGGPAQPVRDRRRPERRRTSRCRTSTSPTGLTHRRSSTTAASLSKRLRRDAQATSTTGPTRRRWTASRRRRTSSSPARPPARRSTSRKEDPQLRDRYGRHTWGQSTLLARRLVEAGSTFVDRPPRRLGPSLGSEEGLRELPADRRQPGLGAVHRPGRPRPARRDAGGAVRRVQPHAEDERRRQRRRRRARWARRAATTGATRCSA